MGPCRVADTRLNIRADWPGPVAGFTGRQIWGFSSVAGYNYNDFQGGTGIAGIGNCAGTVYGTPYPVSVVATIAVVNTSATGYLRAWNGGTTLTVGGILGWNAGDVLSNTTVIPMDRTIAEYPGSGPYKRDFAVYNNSGNPVDVIVDVVGYFIVNQATPLDCINVTNTCIDHQRARRPEDCGCVPGRIHADRNQLRKQRQRRRWRQRDRSRSSARWAAARRPPAPAASRTSAERRRRTGAT